MSRFLLDTGPAQDFVNRRHGVLERADAERHRGNRIGICVPVLGDCTVVSVDNDLSGVPGLTFGTIYTGEKPLTLGGPRKEIASGYRVWPGLGAPTTTPHEAEFCPPAASKIPDFHR